MLQLAAVLVSFITIPIFNKKNFGTGITLLTTALIMAILNGFAPRAIINTFLEVFTTANSRETIIVVAIVSVVGRLMKEYQILDKVVEALSGLVKNTRLLFVLIPSMVGILIIPGGAILSAPFIFSLGEQVGMPAPRRAACNLMFRHVSMFIMPYSSSILVVRGMLPQYSLLNIIGTNAIFAIGMIIAGYIFYLRRVPKTIVNNQKSASSSNPLADIKNLIIYASPIYSSIVLNMITGIPLYICMVTSLVLLYLLGPKKGFLKLSVTSVSYNTVLSVIGVFFIQGIVTNLPGLIGVFTNLFDSGVFAIPALLLACVLFGMITGFHMVPMSIVFPMLLGLGLGKGELLAYVYFVYCWAFVGYYFSPLHMCQIFTCEYMDVKLKDLMKEYVPSVIFIVAYIPASFIVLRFILPSILG